MAQQTSRESLRDRVDDWFETPLILASIALIVLLLVELTHDLGPLWELYIEWLGLAIWSIFALEFGARIWLSSDRWRYLREHWLDAVAVALPPLRIFRGIRALQVLIYGSRGADEFLERLRRRKLGKLAVISVFVVIVGSALLYLAENDHSASPIGSFGDALYWTTVAVLSGEAGLDMATLPGRLIEIGLAGYSVVVFSYLVGAVASLWIENDRGGRAPARGSARDSESGSTTTG